MSTSTPGVIKNHAAFIWSVADLLRGDYKQSEYGKVILPLTVIRRLDCVLEPTKPKVLAVHRQYGDRDAILRAAAGDLAFYNTSPLTLQRVLADPTTIADQLRAYLAGFSEAARDVIEKFDFDAQITRLARANLLYLVVSKFCDPLVDLTRTRCPTWRWVICTRSWSAASPSCPMKPRGSTSRRARSSG